MRKKLLMWNTTTALISKFVAIICAFILPRLILKSYGTEVNGLVSSISQFLTIISLTEFGVTAVVQSALYRPLAEKDNDSISKIMLSSARFFKKIGYILVLYIFVLCIIYPVMVNNSFGSIYTIGLILAMSINSLVQYLFGITKAQLISASQRGYIINITEVGINLLNTILCCVLILLGASIQVIKITTGLIYIIQPIIYTIYIKRNYSINYDIEYVEEPIKQKWNGVAQHIAYYILNSTDTIVLTIFSTLENVSIYYVYKLVLSGIHQILSIIDNSVKPLFGEILAIKESKKVQKYFHLYEWLINGIICLVFGCTLTLIVPFIKVYTKGINDSNYIVPQFAIIFTLAYVIQNIRNPYNVLIMSAGHYKQTQKNYIITAVINIIISVFLVYKFGLIGVAIGTFVALLYQTIWQAWYVYNNILKCTMKYFIKIIIVNIVTLIIGYTFTRQILLDSVSYLGFGIMAIKVFIIWGIIVLLINLVFFKQNIKTILNYIKRNDKNN